MFGFKSFSIYFILFILDQHSTLLHKELIDLMKSKTYLPDSTLASAYYFSENKPLETA